MIYELVSITILFAWRSAELTMAFFHSKGDRIWYIQMSSNYFN